MFVVECCLLATSASGLVEFVKREVKFSIQDRLDVSAGSRKRTLNLSVCNI
jgi:head-tail adaptor